MHITVLFYFCRSFPIQEPLGRPKSAAVKPENEINHQQHKHRTVINHNKRTDLERSLIFLALNFHCGSKTVKEKSRESHNHKPQPFPDTKGKRKQTKPNKRKSNKCTKSTKISSLFPKRGNCDAQTTEKHKNKITLG